MVITAEHMVTATVSIMNAGYLLSQRWASRRAAIGAWALALLSIGVATQSAFISLVLLPRGSPSHWHEARGWLLAGILAMAGAIFLAVLILSRARHGRR